MTRQIPRTYEEAVTAADAARDRAYAVRDAVRAHVVDLWVRGVRDYHGTPIKTIVERHLQTNPHWRAAVADNRWYLDYAVAYAQRELIHLLQIGVVDRVYRDHGVRARGR